MAIYHLNAKVISRGKGQCATAAAAYRAGEKITDLRTGLTFDYSRKRGVDATEIIAPENVPDWLRERARLWNEVELFETRTNSRLAREFDIALPVELGHSQKQDLVRGFVKEQLVSFGLVADVAFHDLNSHNPHVHIMLATRRIDEQGFGAKERDLDRKDFLVKLRESWSVHANRALEQAGESERIDHRTLEEQGINRIPQIHLGPDVAAMKAKGVSTERGDEYDRIERTNAQLEALLSQLASNWEQIAQASIEQPAAPPTSTLNAVAVALPQSPAAKKKKRQEQKESIGLRENESTVESEQATLEVASFERDLQPVPQAQQQQWILSNFESLREAIAIERKQRFEEGVALSPDDHELSVGKYHLHYRLPTQIFTISANDGRGEIFKGKLSKKHQYFWRTQFRSDDLQFLCSLAQSQQPPQEQVRPKTQLVQPLPPTQQQLFRQLLEENPQDADSLDWDKARSLYESYTANPKEYALYTNVPDQGGGLNNPRTAGRVAVKKAERDNLTEAQIELLLVHNPKVPEFLNKSGINSAKEYIQSIITRARKEGIKPYWLSGETAQLAYSTYSPQPEQFNPVLLLLAENLVPTWQQLIPNLTVNDLHRDLWVAVKAMEQGWGSGKTKRILYSSPIAYESSLPLSSYYRDGLINKAYSLIERLNLQLPEKPEILTDSRNELDSNQLALVAQLSIANLPSPQELNPPKNFSQSEPEKITFISETLAQKLYQQYRQEADEIDNFVQVAHQALLDNHTLKVAVFIARQNPLFKDLERLLPRTSLAGNFLRILLEQNLPRLEPQSSQDLLQDESTFSPEDSLKILEVITQTIEAKQKLSPSNQKATRYIIEKLTEIIEPMEASLPSARDSLFSTIQRLNQCLGSSPLQFPDPSQQLERQPLSDAPLKDGSQTPSNSPDSPINEVSAAQMAPARPPITPLEREEKPLFNPSKKSEAHPDNLQRKPSAPQPIALALSSQAAVRETPSPEQSSLSDAQLLAAVKAVKQWQKHAPREPDWLAGESLRKQIDALKKRFANREKTLLSQQQELSALGKPRSLLNPFGVSESVIIEKQIELQNTQIALDATKRELNRLSSDFQDWQNRARTYQAWQQDPQTKKMNELVEQLSSPENQTRLQELREGYAIYEAALTIFGDRGVQLQKERSFSSQSYRIEQRGQTLTLTHKDRSEPLFRATDLTKAGGILEIHQSNLTEEDKKVIQGAASFIKQKQRERELDRGFGLV